MVPILNSIIRLSGQAMPAAESSDGDTVSNESDKASLASPIANASDVPSPAPLEDAQPQHPTATQFFPIADELSMEDDELLNMQIELGKIEARTLKREIESKKRKVANESQPSSRGFNLSAELSMEMDRDRASKLPSALERIRELEREQSLFANTLARTQQEAFQMAKASLLEEFAIAKAEIRQNMFAEAAANAETHESQSANHAEMQAHGLKEIGELKFSEVKQECLHEVQEAHAYHESRLERTVLIAQTYYDTELLAWNGHLRRSNHNYETASAELSTEKHLHLLFRNENESLRDHLDTMHNELQAITSEQGSPGRINAEATMLRTQLERLKEPSTRGGKP